MKGRFALTTIAAASLAFGLGQEAGATSWFDYQQPPGQYTIGSTSNTNTTVLATVTVRCPAAGWLVAHAETQFGLYEGGATDYSQVGYSITRDTTAPYAYDSTHYNYLKEYVPSGVYYSPAYIQRVDPCTAGATYTYRCVAWRVNAGAQTYAWQPTLYVDYYDRKI